MGLLDAPSKPSRVVVPGRIAAMGDSITANGTNAASGASGVHYGSQSYLVWACMQSGGRLKNAGVYATGGLTSAQILSTHLPQVLAASPRPQFCVVHAGTNDYGTLTLAQSIANLTSIYRQLTAAGITPILTTMLPKQTLLNAARVTGFLEPLSVFVRRYARDNGLPCVDWTTPFLSPTDGNWVGYVGAGGTYQVDNTHPNSAGAKIMGAAIVTAVSGYLSAGPITAQHQYQPSGFAPSSTNALLLNDANANGRPDGWDYCSAPGSVTTSLVANGDGFGNYYKTIFASGLSGGVTLEGDPTAAVTGRRFIVSARLKTVGMKTGNGKLMFLVRSGNNDNYIAGLRDWSEDIPAGSVFTQEFTIPSGMSTQNIKLFASMTPVSGSLLNAVELYIGEVLFADLDAAGL